MWIGIDELLKQRTRFLGRLEGGRPIETDRWMRQTLFIIRHLSNGKRHTPLTFNNNTRMGARSRFNNNNNKKYMYSIKRRRNPSVIWSSPSVNWRAYCPIILPRVYALYQILRDQAPDYSSKFMNNVWMPISRDIFSCTEKPRKWQCFLCERIGQNF
jgi:hypothetical protein